MLDPASIRGQAVWAQLMFVLLSQEDLREPELIMRLTLLVLNATWFWTANRTQGIVNSPCSHNILYPSALLGITD